MFLEELNLMRRLSHPHIIRYLGCGMIEHGSSSHIAIVRPLSTIAGDACARNIRACPDVPVCSLPNFECLKSFW